MRSKFDLRDEKWHCIHNGILYDGQYMFYVPRTKTGTVVYVHKNESLLHYNQIPILG